MISFVYSNPGHHAEMMMPVVAELSRRGADARVVSIAELRGFATPSGAIRALPRLRKSPSVGAGLDAQPGGSIARKLAQEVAWRGAIGPRLRWLLRGSELVVVPNDAAYPYDRLVASLRRRGVPVALMQEGIRFPLPNEKPAVRYGAGGSSVVCCWGQAAAEHFEAIGSRSSLLVTGNPRYDAIDPAAWRAQGDELLARLGLAERPLLFLSNPIDDQGFCTTAEKLALFEGFARAARTPMIVKLHPREDAAAFRARAPANVHVVTDAPLFAVLAAGRAAVVLASTVGLEALLFGLPLGVLAIPGHGHVFEYVARDAAVPLALDDAQLPAQLAKLLAGGSAKGAAALLERHLAHRGTAARHVADAIEAVHA